MGKWFGKSKVKIPDLKLFKIFTNMLSKRVHVDEAIQAGIDIVGNKIFVCISLQNIGAFFCRSRILLNWD